LIIEPASPQLIGGIGVVPVAVSVLPVVDVGAVSVDVQPESVSAPRGVLLQDSAQSMTRM
jgi:hypothetical protein